VFFISGEYESKLDSKGRLVLPSRIKSNLPSNSSEMILRKGDEPCLVLYPLLEYQKKYAQIRALSEFDENARKLQRTYFMGINPVELDNMGRFVIPKPMLEHAQLQKEVKVIGMGDRIELWHPAVVMEYTVQDPQERSELNRRFLQ